MAPFPISNVLRAQVVFQGTSGLSEDRFVNTFHFWSDVGPPVEADKVEVAAALVSHYNDIPSFDNGDIAAILSADISRAVEASQVRIYDLNDDPAVAPREPHITYWTLDPPDATTKLPTECAIVGSHYGTRNLPRQRGRTYYGPLISSASDGLTGRPLDLIRTRIARAESNLSAFRSTAGNHAWCIASNPVGVAAGVYVVTAGWVDNAFDTQRRRGLAPTDRTQWPPIPGG